MPFIARHCPQCKQYNEVEIFQPPQELKCPNCEAIWGRFLAADVFEHPCPVCQKCRQYFTQKDFNQALGCVIVLIGIVLVPKTYGLSLPVMALVDWIIYRRTKNIVVCYLCGTSFHGFSIPKRLKPFMHHIGLKYDKYRS